MIEHLKKDELVIKVGGIFRLTALVQRRLKELIEGSRPLVDPTGKNLIEVALEEIAQGKIIIDYDKTEGIHKPDETQIATDIHKI